MIGAATAEALVEAAAIVSVGPGFADAPSPSIIFAPLHPAPTDGFVELAIRLAPAEQGYNYSKLYYCCDEEELFAEDRVLCFRIRRREIFESVRILLPPAARASGFLRLRLDGLPYVAGAVEARIAGFVDAESDDELSRVARLLDGKERVRAAVEASEAEQRATLPHYPESLSLELTAGCNLTCSHCSSHGDERAHGINNRRSAFDPAMLERLAEELFPHLTLVNLVGRGEPTMVPDALWNRLVFLLDHHRVLLTCVTNGYFLRRRVTEAMLPIVDTITVSIDGTTPDVFALNRGGADLDLVLDNVAHYDRLRRNVGLVRRPRLGFSWTLKRNNIHQFPDFIRMILPFEPDLLYVRHLFIFREKDAAESLLGRPELVNPHLREAYALLEGSRIKLDVPPLMAG